MFQKLSASDVTNMDTMQEIVQPGRQYASTTDIDLDPPQKDEDKRDAN